MHEAAVAGTWPSVSMGGEVSGVGCVGLEQLARLITSVAAHHRRLQNRVTKGLKNTEQRCARAVIGGTVAPRHNGRRGSRPCHVMHGGAAGPPRHCRLYHRTT
jgi:hypothetical protein